METTSRLLRGTQINMGRARALQALVERTDVPDVRDLRRGRALHPAYLVDAVVGPAMINV